MTMNIGNFPAVRPRRLRQQPWIRQLTHEVSLTAAQLIYPLFVMEGQGEIVAQQPIASLPNIYRHTIDGIITQAQQAADAGIAAIALFPVTPAPLKTDDGREALNPNNLLCRTIAAVKSAVPQMGIIADVALDPYTSHGHDGLWQDGQVLNDATVAILCQQAVLLAKAGADVVAPSDMMDGRIAAIRQSLDAANFSQTMILSYAAKYASALYAPFRDAVGSASHLQGDKKTYQMQPHNQTEGLREAMLDIQEGADMLMVKPAMLYLDMLYRISAQSPIPTLAYQVSGEYAMLHHLSGGNAEVWQKLMLESLISCRRAGAQAIFTYAALEAAHWLRGESRI